MSATPSATVAPKVETIRAASVVWVKQSKFPWWPAMVTYDPSTGSYSKPAKGKPAGSPPAQFHVQFFGERPLRGWISAKTGMREWVGPKGAGEDLREKQKIPKTYLADWPTALEQAETAFGLNFTQRMQMFATDFREVTTGMPSAASAASAADAAHASYSSDESEEELEPEQIWVTPDDPKKPKKVTCAYFFFTASRRAALIEEKPELGKDVTQIAKALGIEWAAMDTGARKPFITQNEKDRTRYTKAMEKYVPLEKVLITNPSKKQKKKADKAARKKKKDKNAPKRGTGPYFLFANDTRAKISAENPSMKITQVAGKLGAMWQALSEDDKKPCAILYFLFSTTVLRLFCD